MTNLHRYTYNYLLFCSFWLLEESVPGWLGWLRLPKIPVYNDVKALHEYTKGLRSVQKTIDQKPPPMPLMGDTDCSYRTKK